MWIYSKWIRRIVTMAEVVEYLGLALDTSLSMATSFTSMVDQMATFLHEKRENTPHKVVLTLVLFNTNVHVVIPETPLDERSIATVIKELRDTQCAGSTALYDAFKQVGALVAEKGGDGMKHSVVLLTDGIENCSECTTEEFNALWARRQAQGWYVAFLGLGSAAGGHPLS